MNSIDKFLNRAKEKHKNKFDYSLVKYKNEYTPVKIICSIHGEIDIEPRNHLRSIYGCKECFEDSRKKFLNTEDFIDQAIKIHGNRYSYEKTQYKGSVKDEVIVTCKIHGDIPVQPTHHLREEYGGGCKKCADEKLTMPFDEFVSKSKKLHSNFYDYSNSEELYINGYTKIKINCPKHGEFPITPQHHLEGQGCKLCSIERQKTGLEEFIKRAKSIHEDRYSYENFVYENNKTKSEITCKIHGPFFQSPSNHINHKQGCDKCINKSEGFIAEILQEKEIFHRSYRIKPHKFLFDFYLPEHKLIIERDGEQHYDEDSWFNKTKTGRPRNQREIDLMKTNIVLENDLSIARIPYWLNKNEVKQELENILAGKPTYSNTPDKEEEKIKLKPCKIN